MDNQVKIISPRQSRHLSQIGLSQPIVRAPAPIIDAEVRQVRRINGMGKVIIAMWLLFAVMVAVSWSSAGVLLVGGFVAGALLTAVTAMVVWLTIR